MIVQQADDPYKKYWWAILGVFGLTGVWLCLPLMETSVGSTRIDTSKLAAGASAEQSLEAAAQPSGSPTDGLDLSMDGTYRRKKSEENITSMLYQAPEGDKAALTASASSAGSVKAGTSLAQSLKAVGDKKDSSWGGEQAQRGFSLPHLAGGALSGLGSHGGGATSASASSMGAFGSRNAQVGYASTRGLHDDGSADEAKAGTMAALKQTAKTSVNAAGQLSGDAASGGLRSAFDGAKAANAINAGGAKAGADAGLYANLDAAPANLKADNPDLTKKEFTPPPTADATDPQTAQADLGKQLAMAAVTAAIGGMIPGVGGQVAAAMMNVMVQHYDQSDKQKADQQKANNG